MACLFVPDEFPILQTGQVILRNIRAGDARAWFGYLRDPRVTRLTSWDVESVEDVQNTIARLGQRFADKEAMRWAIVAGRGDRLIGTCGFARFDESDNRGEVGYDLAHAFWGRGLMADALAAVLAYGFDTLGLHRIEATVMVGNERSTRLLERCGFIREGELRGYRKARGRYRDMEIYGLLRREWQRDR